MNKFYLLQMQGDVEPFLHGPFTDPYLRQEAFITLLMTDDGLLGDIPDTVVSLIVSASGTPHVGSFSGGYVDHLRLVAEARLKNQKPKVPAYLKRDYPLVKPVVKKR